MSFAEVYEGVFSRNPQEAERELVEFLRGLVVLNVDPETCRRFEMLGDLQLESL